jgi:hypothetical protein
VSIATPPTSGGRLELSLQGQSPDDFVYELKLLWSGQEHVTAARVALPAGEVSFESGDAPAWLVAAAHAFLRGLFRDVRAGEALPRRVTRWRAEPASASLPATDAAK